MASKKNNTMAMDSFDENLGQATIPSPKPTTGYAGLEGSIGAIADQTIAGLAERRKSAETAKSSSLDELTKALSGRQGETSMTDTAYKDTVDPLEQELNDINQQILQEQHGLRRTVERLNENKEGYFGTGLQQRIDVETAKSVSKQADLAIIQLARQGKYDSAKAIADRAVAAKFENQNLDIENKKYIYEQHKDLFTTAEQREFETMISDRERKLDLESSKELARYNAMLDASKETGTTSTYAPAVTFDEYVSARESELGMNVDPASDMYAQFQKEYQQEYGQNTEFLNTLLATAGGKALTDTTIQKLDKGITVLGQLGVLQANIADQKTGPLVGAFRSANPWDSQAQVIKAQLNAVVPNLARGIYGEVGVLTDNDIKTYAGTLGNLRSKEDVNNAIMYITLDMIGRSIQSTLKTNAAAGRDVSGFVDLYQEMEGTKNSILSSIGPGAMEQGGSSALEGEDIFNAIIGQGGGSYEQDLDQATNSWMDMVWQGSAR